MFLQTQHEPNSCVKIEKQRKTKNERGLRAFSLQSDTRRSGSNCSESILCVAYRLLPSIVPSSETPCLKMMTEGMPRKLFQSTRRSELES